MRRTTCAWWLCCGLGWLVVRVDALVEVDVNDDATPFADFVAHNKTMTCSSDAHVRPFNNQIRGVNLGGWMVLEPWITPSLFYQFLSGGENTTAFDTYTFCQVLGAAEANRQLRNHWGKWVTKEIVATLAASGAVNSIRLPVGDYMYQPYGPYVGCFDGALDYVDDLLDWAYEYGISVLFDIHTMKDSQNGFDNSGQALGFQWTTMLSAEYVEQVSFQHWPIREARWIGTFDQTTASYTSINYANIQHALDVIAAIVDRHANHAAVLGLEPLNEPWQYTPIDVLKRFYWDGYLIVKRKAPFWKYIMHDSFRLDVDLWGGFMDGCPDRALDTHIYQAWRDPDSRLGFYDNACREKQYLAAMERAFGPVVVGEWSLATDNCAMWLNGFNDNLPGFPRLPCKYIPCGESYLGVDGEQPGVPLDPGKPLLGPYGTGLSGPIYGLCPTTRDWIKESNGNPITGRDWIRAPPEAPRHLDDTDHVMRQLTLKKLDAFAGIAHGFYFWNFRTDLYDPQWSYLGALERGWIPSGSSLNAAHEDIANACIREDKGEFDCVLKKSSLVLDSVLRATVNATYQNSSNPEALTVWNLTGAELRAVAQDVLSDYFQKFRFRGITCDFGGVAMLVENDYNESYPHDEYRFNTDDEYFPTTPDELSMPIWEWCLFGLGGLVVGLLVGFVLAMRLDPTFNERVRQSKVLTPALVGSHGSLGNLVRSSLKLPDVVVDGEQQPLVAAS